MAYQCRKVNISQLRGGKPAQLAKGGQRDTMHNTLCHTIIITLAPSPTRARSRIQYNAQLAFNQMQQII